MPSSSSPVSSSPRPRGRGCRRTSDRPLRTTAPTPLRPGDRRAGNLSWVGPGVCPREPTSGWSGRQCRTRSARSELDGLTSSLPRSGCQGWSGRSWRRRNLAPAGGHVPNPRSVVCLRAAGRERGATCAACADEPGRRRGVASCAWAGRALTSPASRHELHGCRLPDVRANEPEDRWDPLHHPLTRPRWGTSTPRGLRSLCYDLVLELGSRSSALGETTA